MSGIGTPGGETVDSSSTGTGTQVTVTAPAIPCTDLYRKYYNNPTYLNEIEYNICLAYHKAGQYMLDAGHWVYQTLDDLWNEFWNITKSVGSGIVAAGKYAGQAIGNAAQDVWNGVKGVLNWLDNQAGLAEGWLLKAALLVGGLWLAIELAPAVVAMAETHKESRRHGRS